jgi:EAL domain-containing protein (putative c-di-GMP-specific phosphodiesterase class I)
MALSSEPEAAAEAVVGELARRTDCAYVEVLQLSSGERLQPLAFYSEATGVVRGGPAPDPRRARFLHNQARTGPWVNRPDRRETDHDSPIWNVDLELLAGAPVYSGDQVVGVLLIGVSNSAGATFYDRPAKLMAAAIDYASILSAVAGGALADRREAGAERARLAQDLRARAFHSVFQPIIDLEDHHIVGYEALTRFSDGTPPDVRFADATRLGLGEDFELAAVEAALAEAKRLPDGAFVSLNVSPQVALEATARLRNHVSGTDRQIVLELTEHVPITDYLPLRDAIANLGNVQIAVDDAGAGYASMRHILELRPAFAKLDVSLVRGIDGDDLRQAMAAGIQYYALRTGCRLVAEGVETEQEANALRDLGVDLAQGYLFGRPERLPG